MERLEKVKKNVFKALNDGYDTIKEIVEKEGGFLNTSPELNLDTIYGYALNGEERLEEYYCYGLTIVEGDVLCYLLPIMRTYLETPTKEDMLNDDENWYRLDGADGLTYKPATIVSILDSIEEYTNNEEE